MSKIIVPGQHAQQGDEPLVYREVTGPDGKPNLVLHKTSEFDLKFRPWLVTLVVQPREFASKLYHTEYYVRMGNPQDAVAAAEKMFQQWERKVFAPNEIWPDTNGPARATCLDEGDWFNALKDAKKAKVFQYFGDKGNPQIFTFYPSGWPKYWHPFFKNLKK